MGNTRIQTALNDLLAGKACVDDSRAALADFTESSLNIFAGQRASSANSHLNAALHHLAEAEKLLRFLLEYTGGVA